MRMTFFFIFASISATANFQDDNLVASEFTNQRYVWLYYHPGKSPVSVRIEFENRRWEITQLRADLDGDGKQDTMLYVIDRLGKEIEGKPLKISAVAQRRFPTKDEFDANPKKFVDRFGLEILQEFPGKLNSENLDRLKFAAKILKLSQLEEKLKSGKIR